MRKMFNVVFASLALAASAFASADTPASPVGSWELASYFVPGGGFYASQTVCFKSDNTWYSSTQGGWKGAWFQNGNDLQWYGSVPMAGAGTAGSLATIGIGQATGSGTMAGNYVEWAAPSNLPLAWDKHYTYTLTYKGEVCGAPR